MSNKNGNYNVVSLDNFPENILSNEQYQHSNSYNTVAYTIGHHIHITPHNSHICIWLLLLADACGWLLLLGPTYKKKKKTITIKRS